MSAGSGWILYGLAAVLAVVFWRRMRGRTLQDMIDAGGRAHHHVLKVLEKHPEGGRWRDIRRWMGERGE